MAIAMEIAIAMFLSIAELRDMWRILIAIYIVIAIYDGTPFDSSNRRDC